jgi:hypothetical protein
MLDAVLMIQALLTRIKQLLTRIKQARKSSVVSSTSSEYDLATATGSNLFDSASPMDATPE